MNHPAIPPAASRRIAILPLLLLIAVALTSCNLIIEGSGDPGPVYNASYRSNYRLDTNGDGVHDRSVICDDRITELTYSFNYTTELDSWTSWLEGGFERDEVGRQTFRPGEAGVRYGNDRVEVTYEIDPGTAPLTVDPALAPQGIVVVPNPRQIGQTFLKVRVNGVGFTYTLTSQPIPVIDNCPSS